MSTTRHDDGLEPSPPTCECSQRVLMTPDHAGVQLFPVTAVCFRILQFRMFRMLGVIKYTALCGPNPDIRYAYICAVCIRNRIYTDGHAFRICFALSLEIGFTARRFSLLLSPHSVAFFVVIFKSVHNCLFHISALAALFIAISSASAVSQAIVVIYMHTMHAWLTVQMLWQMHGSVVNQDRCPWADR